MEGVRERVLATLRTEPTFLFALATVGVDGRPRVRTVRGIIDDDLTLRCPTFDGTTKIRHIRACHEVHVTCGDTGTDRPGSYFQIEGHASISTDPVDRRNTWTDRLEKWFTGADDPKYMVIRILPYRITAMPVGGGPAAQVWTRDAE